MSCSADAWRCWPGPQPAGALAAAMRRRRAAVTASGPRPPNVARVCEGALLAASGRGTAPAMEGATRRAPERRLARRMVARGVQHPRRRTEALVSPVGGSGQEPRRWARDTAEACIRGSDVHARARCGCHRLCRETKTHSPAAAARECARLLDTVPVAPCSWGARQRPVARVNGTRASAEAPDTCARTPRGGALRASYLLVQRACGG